MKTTKHSFFVNGLFALAFGLCAQLAFSQAVSIGTTNTAPDPSAMLEMVSTTKGALIPRMTSAQRLAIAAPATGLLVYQNAAAGNFPMGFYYWDGVNWIFLGLENSGKVQQPTTVSDNSFPISASSSAVGITTLSWAPAYTVPPSVLASPEYTVVGTAPAMSAYCGPGAWPCGNAARIGNFRVYYPSGNTTGLGYNKIYFAANNGAACTTNRMYLTQPPATGSIPASGSHINSLNIDFCGSGAGLNYGAIDLVLRATPATNAVRGFTFWIDLNQDGDFDDPSEMIEQRPVQAATTFGDYWIWANTVNQPVFAGAFPPINIPPIVANGLTKMRVISYNNAPGYVVNNPCFGSNFSVTHDFDVAITCGGSAPLFPSDVNVCNVDLVTTNSARVSCFDKNGTPANLKFHYKIIRHD
jgi:hypothetical protein